MVWDMGIGHRVYKEETTSMGLVVSDSGVCSWGYGDRLSGTGRGVVSITAHFVAHSSTVPIGAILSDAGKVVHTMAIAGIPGALAGGGRSIGICHRRIDIRR